MYDLISMGHVSMAIHDDRVRALRRPRRDRSCNPSGPVHPALGFYRRLACRLTLRRVRVERRNPFSN